MQKKLIANASRSHMSTRSLIQLCRKNQAEWITFQHLCFLKRQVGYEVLPFCTHNHKYADQIFYIYRLYIQFFYVCFSIIPLLENHSFFVILLTLIVLTELTDEIENYQICVFMFFI